MKNLYFISGTMGIGKTTICNKLNKCLDSSIFLDGDWCWNADPFVVNAETKKMVEENICFLLNNFLQCSSYQNVIFCWVMNKQEIIDSIISQLNMKDTKLLNISLVSTKNSLVERLEKDILSQKRNGNILEKSLNYLEDYKNLNTTKVDVTDKSIEDIAKEIMAL